MVFFLREIIENKTIIWAMTKQNITGKYKNSFIGLGWNLLEPILLIIAITLVFTSIKATHTEPDYWVYLSSGMFSMTFIMASIRGRSFYKNSNYVKKMAIPKWIPVFADVTAQFFAVIIPYIVIFFGYIIVFRTIDLPSAAFILPIMLLIFVFGLGCSFFFSTLTVMHNDFGYLMTILSRIMIWLTPVFFYLSESNDLLQTVCSYNPITYFIESLHYICSYGVISNGVLDSDFIWYFGMAIVFATVALGIGYLYFRKNQYKIPELL